MAKLPIELPLTDHQIRKAGEGLAQFFCVEERVVFVGLGKGQLAHVLVWREVWYLLS